MDHGGRKTPLPKPSVVCLLVILATRLVNATISKSSCDFPAVFNFGDSNSDTGGLSAAFGQAPPPNGETFFHGPVGRYSDGRLVIDFIGMRLNHSRES